MFFRPVLFTKIIILFHFVISEFFYDTTTASKTIYYPWTMAYYFVWLALGHLLWLSWVRTVDITQCRVHAGYSNNNTAVVAGEMVSVGHSPQYNTVYILYTQPNREQTKRQLPILFCSIYPQFFACNTCALTHKIKIYNIRVIALLRIMGVIALRCIIFVYSLDFNLFEKSIYIAAWTIHYVQVAPVPRCIAGASRKYKLQPHCRPTEIAGSFVVNQAFPSELWYGEVEVV
jgi:hypothetical protein